MTTEAEVMAELDKEPFQPFRLHMVSGKVFDVLAPNVAPPLKRSLLVLRNPVLGTRRADGYDVISHANTERIEELDLGRPAPKKRKRA
ncbi:MAG TPA: hypothetical protein VER17_05160 [Tepidisphaeraceae bacterium]|nr:hypothetical protein [Tepidisphaeraceae bacterium]